MTICPYCGGENIEGVDQCEECGQSLADMHLEGPLLQVEQSLLTDRIGLLDPKTPITVAADTPVGEVLRLMVDKSVGCLIVVDGKDPVGIFSERDALLKLNVDASRLSDRPVSEYMTTNPRSRSPCSAWIWVVTGTCLSSVTRDSSPESSRSVTSSAI